MQLLPACIPSDVWTEIALQFLDVRDLMMMHVQTLLSLLVPTAVFAAKRVLTDTEIAWFAEHGIRLELLVERLLVATHGDARRSYDNGVFLLQAKLYPMTEWRCNGLLHRENDLPAVEYADGSREWYIHGRRHRKGGPPAIEWVDGRREWWYHGKPHRGGGLPAIERADGYTQWSVHGELHRLGDLPAIVWPDGDRYWYVKGRPHREGDLPAVEYADGRQEWWVNGTKVNAPWWWVFVNSPRE